MNELQLFSNPEFGQVRTFTEPDGKTLFCGADVARALGYKSPKDAILAHAKGAVKRRTLTNGGEQELSFIPEGDIYRLAARSQLPSADKFERWIFDEVLPSVRKTGSYSIEQSKLPCDYPAALRALADEAEQRMLLEAKIEKDEPYTTVGKTIETVQNAIKMDMFAKFVQNTYKGLGRNRMFQLLRDKKVLYQYGGVTMPLQDYMNRGYFVVKESTYTQGGMTNTRPTILITGKGQVWLAKKLSEWLDNPETEPRLYIVKKGGVA